MKHQLRCEPPKSNTVLAANLKKNTLHVESYGAFALARSYFPFLNSIIDKNILANATVPTLTTLPPLCRGNMPVRRQFHPPRVLLYILYTT